MSEILEPVRTILEQACNAASQMMSAYTGKPERIQFVENEYEDQIIVMIVYAGQVMYKHTFELKDNDPAKVRDVIYGSLLTELIAVFCITVTETQKRTKKGD